MSSVKSSVPTGGLTVSAEMKALYERPGFLPSARGGQRLMDLYRKESANFKARELSSFGLTCYQGYLEDVIKLVESGAAPDLTGYETPYRWGYLMLTVAGSQRFGGELVKGPSGAYYLKQSSQHAEVLRYLIKMGAPLGMQDIAGYTALHHACMHSSVPAIARVMLEAGADPNWLDKYGSPSLYGACSTKQVEVVDLLMEFGASLDIIDADGFAMGPANFVKYGAEVTAAIHKSLRKRKGEDAPLEGSGCDVCGRKPGVGDKKFALCSACKLVRYCTKECQKSHWPQHKLTCSPTTSLNSLSFRPYYQQGPPGGMMLSSADLIRNALGNDTLPANGASNKATKITHKWQSSPDSYLDATGKGMIVKVQLPYDLAFNIGKQTPESMAAQTMLVYNKKRDFMCQLSPLYDPITYKAMVRLIKEKGIGGAKAYFRAELHSADKLVIRISEVLAEQQF